MKQTNINTVILGIIAASLLWIAIQQSKEKFHAFFQPFEPKGTIHIVSDKTGESLLWQDGKLSRYDDETGTWLPYK